MRVLFRVVSACVLVPVLALAASSGCAEGIHMLNGEEPQLSETTVRLHEHTLTLHLSAGTHREGPLLIYATGDGGWWGKDVEVFNHIVPWDYPVAGFSARDYVNHLGPNTDVERPVQVADDYLAVIGAARTALGLPSSTRVVLVGKSRGSGLAVAAAAVPRLRVELEGILAIALTREEEYVERRAPGSPRNSKPVMLQTYQALPQIGQVPVAVIQSTRDQYLPSAEAQPLFGPETPVRRFRAIDAEDHNFDGATAQLYVEMARSFAWIVDRRPAGAARLSEPSESTPARRGIRAAARPYDP